MNDGRTEMAEEIFYSALEIKSAEERRVFVDRRCRGDAGLREMVDDLLASQPDADRLFREGGVARLPLLRFEELSRSLPDTTSWVEVGEASAGEDDFIGKSIGSYKLLQRIGEGGCGAVYMAEQQWPVRRRVAFKIIKLGMDTKSVVARFEAERQALALMDHPNIARVLDAGATESGRPYFVMELVRGVKITEYCDQNDVDTRQRLELFMQVCRAIQHAHQKGVIHRDIKPSNILVTIIDGAPVPKVIDFGIAKAIEGRLTDNTIFTAYDQFVGTPTYMSPEQAVMSGVDVDTRSDIYSLGVLLYELLTGRTPFETKELLERGLDGLRRMLQEKEPKRPSVVLTTMQGSALTQLAHHRQLEPVKLVSLLRGDLDWIVIRALEKDRSRRYETANGLAMDVQRFLDNEPVVARPPSRSYRLQKLVRRNKATFLTVAAIVLALVGGLGVSTWFWYQEREARKMAVTAKEQALDAEAQQARLRREAEDRESVTEAAYLISRGKYEEADELAGKVTTIKPSLEAESVWRSLGQWHALKGRWTQAETRFNRLLEVDQKNNSWAITDDLLMAGPIQIEHGDLQGYEHFRRAAIARFHDTTDPVFAERTLKISLLTPADRELMKSMAKLSEVAAGSIHKTPKTASPPAKAGEYPRMEAWRGASLGPSARNGNDETEDPNLEAWRCVSLAIMAYRQDDAVTATTWCKKCLAYPDHNPSRIATAHIIEAMACYRSGELATARSELAEGRNLTTAEFAAGLQEGKPLVGFWYDWLFARILLREAEALIEDTPAGGMSGR